MEPFSIGLFICGMVAAIYQMSGTPFILNLIIFCFCSLLSLYAMFMSGYMVPTDGLFNWISSNSKSDSSDQDEEHEIVIPEHDDQITKKLRELTGHIVRDFILSWYNTVTDDVTFVQEAFEIFEYLLKGARSRVASTNKEVLLSNILTVFLKHYVTYKKALNEIKTKSFTGNHEDDKKRLDQLLILSYIEKNSHPSLEHLPDSEMEHLRGIVILVLKGLLPEDYKLSGTPLFLVRELIAQNVLNSLVNLMSDPLWIYNTLIKILEESEVKSLTNEIDQVGDHNGDDMNDIQLTDAEISSSSSGFNNNTSVGHVRNLSDQTDNLSRDGSPSPALVISENHLSTSRASTTSMASQFSADSDDLQQISPRLEDIPLPLLSSEMHFAPEWSNIDQDASSVKKHIISLANDRTPQDNLFRRIRIPEAIEMKENFDAKRKYTLYKITYKTRELIPYLQQTTAINIPNTSLETADNNDDAKENRNQNQLFRIKKHQVQRRFREFLLLQERLSQNMVAKNLIGDIKGPSRMFPVPFGNMDKEYIEQRRKFLQAYLREICSIPFISHCKELREFLAFEMDPRIAYVRKSESMPRIDKMLKTAFRDLIGSTSMKFSGTIPSSNDDPAFRHEAPNIRQRIESEPNTVFPSNDVANVGAVAKFKNKVFGSSKHYNHENISSTAKRQFASFEAQRNIFSSKWKHEDEIDAIHPDSVEGSTQNINRRGTGDGCDAGSVSFSDMNSDTLSARLVLEFLPEVWNVNPGIHSLVLISLTKYVQAFLTNEINELTTKESWTKLLGKLHDALWPDGEWDSSDEERITWVSASEEVKKKTFDKAQQILESALPDAVQFIVNEKRYKDGVKDILLSLQNPNINRHLFYHLLDLLIHQIFPDVDEVVRCGNVSLNVIVSSAS